MAGRPSGLSLRIEDGVPALQVDQILRAGLVYSVVSLQPSVVSGTKKPG